MMKICKMTNKPCEITGCGVNLYTCVLSPAPHIVALSNTAAQAVPDELAAYKSRLKAEVEKKIEAAAIAFDPLSCLAYNHAMREVLKIIDLI